MSPDLGARAGQPVWRAAALPLLCVLGLIAIEAGLVANRHLLLADILDAVVLFVLVTASVDHLLGRWAVPNQAAVLACSGLALVPLMRIIGLGLPLHGVSAAFGTLAVAGLVGWAVLWLAPELGLSREVLVGGRAPFVQLGTAAAGLGLGLLAYLLGAPRLWAGGASGGRILLVLAAAAAAAIVEELVFRGAVQITLRRATGRVGAPLAAALFASMYLDLRTAALILLIALAGLVFAASVERGASLTGAIAGHLLLALGAGGLWQALFGTRHRPLLHGAPTTVVLALAVAAAAAWLLRAGWATAPGDVSVESLADVLGPEPAPERELSLAMIRESALAVGTVAAGPGVSASRTPQLAALKRAVPEDLNVAARWLLSHQGSIERSLSSRRGLPEASPAFFGVLEAWVAGKPALCGLLCDLQIRPVAALPLGPVRPLDSQDLIAALGGLRTRVGLPEVILVARGEHLSQDARGRLAEGAWAGWVVELTRLEVEALARRGFLDARRWRPGLAVTESEELFPGEQLIVRWRPALAEDRLQREERLEQTGQALAELARRTQGGSLSDPAELAAATAHVLRRYDTVGRFRVHIAVTELAFERNQTQIAADQALEQTSVLRVGGKTATLALRELATGFDRLQQAPAGALLARGPAEFPGLDGEDRARAELLLKLLVLEATSE